MVAARAGANECGGDLDLRGDQVAPGDGECRPVHLDLCSDVVELMLSSQLQCGIECNLCFTVVVEPRMQQAEVVAGDAFIAMSAELLVFAQGALVVAQRIVRVTANR